MENEKRFYLYWIRTYINENDILQFIRIHNVKCYAYIYHDKDTDKDGKPVEPHYHVLLKLSNAKSFSAMLKCFEIYTQNTHIEVCQNKLNCYNYLTHKNNEDKHKYSEEDIHCNNKAYFISDDDEEKNRNALDIIDDIINKVSYRDMVVRYGRDYIINYQKYVAFAEFVKIEDNNKRIEEHLKKQGFNVDKDGEVHPFK